MSNIRIKDRIIGDGEPTYIIAEMSANHGGSIEHAKEIIHAAKEAGADCIKIQTYTADTLTIPCDNEYFHLKDGTWKGENLYGLYEKAYTPWEWQAELKEEAEKIGLDFFSTPFDFSSVDFLEEIGVEFYKIASFELIDIPLVKYVASKGKPIIMSTGMATLGEIEDAVNAIYSTGNKELCLLKCTSSYPADCSNMNLRTIPNMKEIFQIPVGLSDHSMGGLCPSLAVAMGASVIEKHICISRNDGTPDSSFSMEPHEFKEMVEMVRKTEKALGKVVYKSNESEKNDIINRRSLFAVKDIKKGEILTPENIRSIRPGHGMKPKYYEEVLGQRAVTDIAFGTPLHFDMIAKY